MRQLLVAATAMGLAAVVGGAEAQCLRQKLFRPNGLEKDFFGLSLDVSGDWLVVGVAPADPSAGVDAGVVDVFHRDFKTGAWEFHAELAASDGAAGDRFGYPVVISGDVIAAAALGDDDSGSNAGSVYVFRRDPKTAVWAQEAKLVAPVSPLPPKDFGTAIAICGEVIVVGDPTVGKTPQPPADYGYGAAYVYRHNGTTWPHEATLHAADQAWLDYFANQITADGNDKLLITSLRETSTTGAEGAVYAFQYNAQSMQWAQTQKIKAQDPPGHRLYGAAIAIDGNRLAIGSSDVSQWPAPSHVDVEILTRDDLTGQWAFESKVSGTPQSVDALYLSHWIGLGANTLIFGDSPTPMGFGRRFQQAAAGSAWTQQADLIPPDGDGTDERFGANVVMDGDRVLVASDKDATLATDAGAVYVIELAGADCNSNGVCDAADIATGTSLDANGNGVPDECERATGDINRDGFVNIDDLLAAINAWGPCPPPVAPCVADVAPQGGGDGTVNIDDLLMVIMHWS